MNKTGRKYFFVILILALMGLIMSYILAQDFYFHLIYKKSGEKLSLFSQFSSAVCGEGASFVNCTKVTASKFSKLFGIPLAFWGIFYFILMASFIPVLLLTGDKIKKYYSALFFWFILLGSVFDLALFFISLFWIKAVCSLCIITYASNWISLLVLLLYFRRVQFNPFNLTDAIDKIRSYHKKDLFAKYIPLACIVIIFAGLTAYGSNRYLLSVREKFILKVQKEAFKHIVKDFRKTKTIDVNPSPLLTIGDPDAPVTIVEFSDFLCPYCSIASKVIEEIIKENPEKVKLVFMNYPLDKECNTSMNRQVHPGSCLVARGGISASNQGGFNEYHNLAFKMRVKNPDRKYLRQLAALSGLNVEKFFEDLDSPETIEELNSQLKRGIQLGVRSTPTIYINGKEFKYKPIKALLEKIIDQEYAIAMKRRLERESKAR